MRFLIALMLMATPAAAWEFTPGLPCLLNYADDTIAVELTHDPTQPQFSITLTRTTPWPKADVFSLRFNGPAQLTISTTRHVLSNQDLSLTVIDRGFGNVLTGLAANQTATALLGTVAAEFSLSGAREPVADFAACSVDPTV